MARAQYVYACTDPNLVYNQPTVVRKGSRMEISEVDMDQKMAVVALSGFG